MASTLPLNLTADMAATYWNNVETYWIIPAGMIALYFYGMFHLDSLTLIPDSH